MNPKPIFAVIILLLILLALSYMRPFTKKPFQPKILETRDFSCPGMEGFTFKYPVFEGWEPSLDWKKTDQAECVLYLSDPTLRTPEATPQVRVSKLYVAGMPGKMESPPYLSKTNPNNIKYSSDEGNVEFWDGISALVRIEILAASVSGQYGFSHQIFFQTVIESFKLIENEYKPLSELKSNNPNFLNALAAVKQELQKDKESQNDFYAEIENAEGFGANTIIIHLWDKNDYESNSLTIGNPSGKSRDIYYNSDLGKITKIQYWQ